MAKPGHGSEASGTAQPSQKLPRSARILKSDDFREIFAQGRSEVGRYMVLWTRQEPAEATRLGVVASRKIGGAVARNRAKRLLRECFRRHRFALKQHSAVVLVARGRLPAASFSDAQEEFLRLARRADLLTKGAGPA